MSDHNDNNDDNFVDDVLNDDEYDIDVPYGINDDDDDNIDFHDDDACHNTSGY